MPVVIQLRNSLYFRYDWDTSSKQVIATEEKYPVPFRCLVPFYPGKGCRAWGDGQFR